METIGYLKNDKDGRTYRISEDLTVEGNGSFWHNITSWAADHWDTPGWYIKPVVVDSRLLRAAAILENLKVAPAEG